MGSPGELNNGVFSYSCVTDSDAVCESNDIPLNALTRLPQAFAVGGRFNLAYAGDLPETEDGYEYSVVVVPASTLLVHQDGVARFRVADAGEAAMLARGGETVADFIHVHATPVDHLDVTVDDAAIASLTLASLSSTSVRALPRDADGITLGGSLGYLWSTSDDAIVTVAAATADNDATLQAIAPGAAIVTVSVGGVVTEIPVTVEESL
jgi:hypothetical protein